MPMFKTSLYNRATRRNDQEKVRERRFVGEERNEDGERELERECERRAAERGRIQVVCPVDGVGRLQRVWDGGEVEGGGTKKTR